MQRIQVPLLNSLLCLPMKFKFFCNIAKGWWQDGGEGLPWIGRLNPGDPDRLKAGAEAGEECGCCGYRSSLPTCSVVKMTASCLSTGKTEIIIVLIPRKGFET